MIRKSILCSLSTLAAIASQGVAAQADDALFNASKPLEIVDQGTFSIPGRYVKAGEHTIMVGAMYVQYQIPKNKTRPYPIVFIHGGGQTAANYLSTPDGRRGWADDFVANGYAVYLVDQPGRGRSGFISAAYGKPRTQSVEENVSRLTDTKHRWPQDGLHTQWPGAGKPGDPAFDDFMATRVEGIGDELLSDQLNREAGAKLLDRIGPAVLLTHSQSGMVGWTIANDRPDLVRGILALEPSGPPIRNINEKGPPDYFSDGAALRPWGITRGPMVYDPPVASPEELKLVRQEQPDAPGSRSLLHAGGAGAQARQLSRHPDPDGADRGLAARSLRPLHLQMADAGRREAQLRPPAGHRDSRQRPRDDAGKEQPGNFRLPAEMGAGEYSLSSRGARRHITGKRREVPRHVPWVESDKMASVNIEGNVS